MSDEPLHSWLPAEEANGAALAGLLVGGLLALRRCLAWLADGRAIDWAGLLLAGCGLAAAALCVLGGRRRWRLDRMLLILMLGAAAGMGLFRYPLP